jgi:hypothetical protein
MCLKGRWSSHEYDRMLFLTSYLFSSFALKHRTIQFSTVILTCFPYTFYDFLNTCHFCLKLLRKQLTHFHQHTTLASMLHNLFFLALVWLLLSTCLGKINQIRHSQHILLDLALFLLCFRSSTFLMIRSMLRTYRMNLRLLLLYWILLTDFSFYKFIFLS